MEVLVVAPTLPHPGVRHAGGLYLLDHLQRLAQRVDRVVLLCIDTAASPADVERAPGEVDLVLADTAAPPVPWWRRARHRLAARLRPAALGADAVESLLAAGLVDRARAADLVELQWPELEVLVPILRRSGVTTPIVVLEHDVGLEAAASRARLASGRARATAAVLGRVRVAMSRRDLDRADLVLVFKHPDVALLRRAGVATPVEVIDPRLDPPAPPAERVPGAVLFTGAMWRPENDEGAAWLLTAVWPAVRRAVPGASLTIAGAGPSDELRRLASSVGGVEVTGEVDDLGPFYASASLFVAPLRIAGGLKFKVAQAMLDGLPVVATPVAAAGIDDVAPSGTLWAVTDDAGAMATAIVAALEAPDQAAATGRAAAEWASARWSSERSMDALVERYRQLAGAAR